VANSAIVNNAENVHIGEVTFMHSPFWTVHLLYSRHITVDGITIRNRVENQHAPSSDGVDVDSCEYVLIQNCDIESNDDNICLKSGRDADGLRVNRPCRYVRIRNNLTRRGAALITFGSETSGGIDHVYISDMEANGTTRGIRFKSAKTRGGIVEKILIERVTIQKVPFVFEFTLNWNPDYSYARLPEGYDRESLPAHWKTLLEPVVPAERGIGKLRDIVISNLEAKEDCWKAFYVDGFLESPIKNIVFYNCHVSTETAGEISHVRNWKAFESSFSFEDGKPPVLTNAFGIDSTFLGGDTD